MLNDSVKCITKITCFTFKITELHGAECYAVCVWVSPHKTRNHKGVILYRDSPYAEALQGVAHLMLQAMDGIIGNK